MPTQTHLTRRAFVCSAVAAGAVALAPAAPALPVAASPPPIAPLKPAWVVGTPGENDAQVIRALTSEEALKIAVEEYCGASECFCAEAIKRGWNPPCDYCMKAGDYEATRVVAWDNLSSDPTMAQWFEAGFGCICNRCDYEMEGYSGTGYVVADEAVCEDCMELADWEIVNPQRAAEMREEGLA